MMNMVSTKQCFYVMLITESHVFELRVEMKLEMCDTSSVF